MSAGVFMIVPKQQ